MANNTLHTSQGCCFRVGFCCRGVKGSSLQACALHEDALFLHFIVPGRVCVFWLYHTTAKQPTRRVLIKVVPSDRLPPKKPYRFHWKSRSSLQGVCCLVDLGRIFCLVHNEHKTSLACAPHDPLGCPPTDKRLALPLQVAVCSEALDRRLVVATRTNTHTPPWVLNRK